MALYGDDCPQLEERAAILGPSSLAFSARWPSAEAGTAALGWRQESGRTQRVGAAGIVALGFVAIISVVWAASGEQRRSLPKLPEHVLSLAEVAPKLHAQLAARPRSTAEVTGTASPVVPGTPKSLLAESLLAALGSRAEKVAPQMSAKDVASILDAYIQLHAHPGASLVAALDLRAQQVGPQMGADEVARTLNAYARMSHKPGSPLWAVLESRTGQVAPDMSAQAVADSLNACVLLGLHPRATTQSALKVRAQQVAPNMSAEAVANTMRAFAKMAVRGDAAWAALGDRAEDVAPQMGAEDVANTIDAYSTLGKQPDKPLWAALDLRTEEVAPDMGGTDIAHVLKAYVGAYKTLRRKPGDDMLVAIQQRLISVSDSLPKEELISVMKSYAQLQQLIDGRGNQDVQHQAQEFNPMQTTNSTLLQREDTEQPSTTQVADPEPVVPPEGAAGNISASLPGGALLHSQ